MAKRKTPTTGPAIDATAIRRSTRSSAKAGVSSHEVETKPLKKVKTENSGKAVDDAKSATKQTSKFSPVSDSLCGHYDKSPFSMKPVFQLAPCIRLQDVICLLSSRMELCVIIIMVMQQYLYNYKKVHPKT